MLDDLFRAPIHIIVSGVLVSSLKLSSCLAFVTEM
jgi:hypothetical protein